MNLGLRIALLAGLFSGVGFGQRIAPPELEELLILLRSGVPSAAVLDIAQRYGGPASVVEGDLDRARDAGANSELMAHLAWRLETHQRLRRLAQEYQVWTHPEGTMSLLMPQGFEPSHVPTQDGDLVVFQKGLAESSSWFTTPRLFCWVRRGSPFPAGAEGELGPRLFAEFEGLLGRARMEPREVQSGTGRVGLATVPAQRFRATVPGLRFEGQVVLRCRVFPGGTIAVWGWAASDGEAEFCASAFEDFCATYSIR